MAMPLHDLQPGDRVEMIQTYGMYPPDGTRGTVVKIWPHTGFDRSIVTVEFDEYGERKLFHHRVRRAGDALGNHAAHLLDLFAGGTP